MKVRTLAAYLLPALGVWVGALQAGIHPTLAGVALGLLAGRGGVLPVDALEQRLHGWVAFLIMPLFALANAGVPLRGIALDGGALLVFCGVTLGLLIGKPAGVLLATWSARRLGLVDLPGGVRWR